MKCVIPNFNVKVYGKAVHSLAKISDEVSLEPTLEGLFVKSVNSTRSCVAFYLFKPRFFQHYDDGSPRPLGENTDPRYRLSAKSLLSVFRSLVSLERTVEKCTISLNNDKSRVVFSLECKHAITKTYNLTYMESERLTCNLSKSSCESLVKAEAKVFKETFNSFPSHLEEITLLATPNDISFRNCIDQEAAPDPLRSLSTVTTLDQEEFGVYVVEKDCSVSFCVKEVKAALLFAEYVNQDVSIHFSGGGKPMFISMDGDPSYEVTFISSTINEEPSGESEESHPVPATNRQTGPFSASTSFLSNTSNQVVNSTRIPKPDHNNTSTSEVKVKPHISALMNDSSITLLPTESNRSSKVETSLAGKNDIDTLLEEIDNTRKSEPSKSRQSLNKSQAKSFFFNTKKKTEKKQPLNAEVLVADSDED